MPGTPPTSPRVGAPRYANSDEANFADQVNAVVDAFDDSVALVDDPRLPTLVTGLPEGPVDGQEIYYLADSAKGIVWHLRYRAGSASAYKWEVVGDARALRAQKVGTRTTGVLAPATWFSDGLSPTITVPLSGDYEIEALAGSIFGNAGVAIAPGIQIGTTDLTASDPLAWAMPVALSSGTGAVSARGSWEKTITAGQVVKQRIIHSAAASYNITWGHEVLTVRPLRVG